MVTANLHVWGSECCNHKATVVDADGRRLAGSYAGRGGAKLPAGRMGYVKGENSFALGGERQNLLNRYVSFLVPVPTRCLLG
jgi:hypothetical protein